MLTQNVEETNTLGMNFLYNPDFEHSEPRFIDSDRLEDRDRFYNEEDSIGSIDSNHSRSKRVTLADLKQLSRPHKFSPHLYYFYYEDLKNSQFFNKTQWTCLKKRLSNHRFEILQERKSQYILAWFHVQTVDNKTILDDKELIERYRTQKLIREGIAEKHLIVFDAPNSVKEHIDKEPRPLFLEQEEEVQDRRTENIKSLLIISLDEIAKKLAEGAFVILQPDKQHGFKFSHRMPTRESNAKIRKIRDAF